MYKIIFLYILIFQFFVNSEDNKTDSSVDYFGLILKVFEGLETDCFPELENTLVKERNKTERNKKYPWLGDAIGKNFNDIGDESECIRSIPNTIFIMVNIHNINLTKAIQTIDDNFLNFLEINNFTIGICLMSKCKATLRRYATLLTKYLLKNMSDENHISFIENDKFDNNSTDNANNFKLETEYIKKPMLYIALAFALLKIVGGIARLIIIPKGYDKYMAEKINKEKKKQNNKEIDQDNEEINLTRKKSMSEPLIKEEEYNKGYNPLYDFTDKLPWYIKILKFFDVWDDLYIISSKRNKYYNDTGLDVINFNRAIIICTLVFSRTFSTLISLPSEEIMNKSFFRSRLNICFRLSKNSFICWCYLEGAYTTYKLLSFISSEMFRYQAASKNGKVNFYIKLFIIYGKFLLLLIPKCIGFIVVFYIFYYRVEDYSFITDAKATFNHIVNHLFTKDIKCVDLKSLFNFTFSLKYEEYTCYEFVHFYFNMILCILISMVILLLFFIIKQQIFEAVIFIANLVYMFVIINFIEDPKISENQKKFLQYHMNGQRYSTKIFCSFFSIYNLGVFTGIVLFNYNGAKSIINRLIYENPKYFKDNIDKIEIDSNDKERKKEKERPRQLSVFSSVSNNDYKFSRVQSVIISNLNSDYKLPYFPLLIINKFMKWLKKKSFTIRIILILVCCLLFFLIDSNFIFFLRKKDNFNIELNTIQRNFFKYEKLTFIVVYCFLNIIMIILPRKGIIRDLMNTKIVIALSRMGFLMTCIVYSFIYLAFIIFYLRIKLYVPTFFIISLGNLLIMSLGVLLIYTLMELSIAIVIKKFLRIFRK